MSLDNRALTKDSIKQFQKKMTMPIPAWPSPLIIKTAKRIDAQFSGVAKVASQFEIEATRNRFSHALEHNNWEFVSQLDWKMAAYVLWYKTDEDEMLGTNTGFTNRYLSWLQHNSMPSDWRKLIHIYLQDFKYRNEYAEFYRRLSRTIRSAFNHASLTYRLAIWKDRDEKLNLFSENFSIDKAVNAFISEAENDWDKFADMTGLIGDLGSGGYSDAIGLELLNRLIKLPNKDLIEAVINFHFIDNNLRFKDRRVSVIEALLSPWLKNPNHLGEEIRKMVLDLLLIQFNDPRLPHNRSKGWRFVNEASLQVILRWLTGESLNQFFSVIDQMALEHQWKYRKAFWKAYNDQGSLDGAWVALGPDAKYYAESAFGKKLSAGELEGGAKSDQSVLIIKIGDLVFAEWSHNGKCRAWRVDHESCPSIYETKYHGNQLKTTSMKIVSSYAKDGIRHGSSETYSWQKKLSEFIDEQTGIRMQHRAFKI